MTDQFHPPPRYAAYANHSAAKRLFALLSAHGEVRLAYLFGSLARGDATPDSDVDVAISLGRKMSASDKEKLIADIGSALGRPVDVIDIESANGMLLGRVFKEGIRLIDDLPTRERMIARRANWQTDVAPYLDRLRAERRAQWLGRG
jgi:predicted nucleotidyltransferase